MSVHPPPTPREIQATQAFEAVLDAIHPGWRTQADMLETPGRVARAWIEMTEGYRELTDDDMTVFDAPSHDLIVRSPIPFDSLCSHHTLAFSGTAMLAYVPDAKIVGLSKITRLVRHYARRFSCQENLTALIADRFEQLVHPQGVWVVMSAGHSCEALRGVRVPGVGAGTATVRGIFATTPHLKDEARFLHEQNLRTMRSNG